MGENKLTIGNQNHVILANEPWEPGREARSHDHMSRVVTLEQSGAGA